jgi:hypothetical protein
LRMTDIRRGIHPGHAAVMEYRLVETAKITLQTLPVAMAIRSFVEKRL